MKSAAIIFAILLAGGAAAPRINAPKAWERETVFGRIAVEDNPWGGFGLKRFVLVTLDTGYSHEQEELAFASREDFQAVERHAECTVEIVGVRVNRAGRSWIVVEQVRGAK